MPRHGNTRRSDHGRWNGHRMHKRTRLARLRVKPGSGRLRKPTAWGRAGLS